LSEDILIPVDNANRYIYVKNNPIIFTDPTGMICFYNQQSGRMDCTGPGSGQGHSGRGPGYNNPEYNNVRDMGPLPKGCYIVGAPYDAPGTTGPISRRLDPFTPDFPYSDRDAGSFRMHGGGEDSSSGCMIMPPSTRRAIPTGEMICVD